MSWTYRGVDSLSKRDARSSRPGPMWLSSSAVPGRRSAFEIPSKPTDAAFHTTRWRRSGLTVASARGPSGRRRSHTPSTPALRSIPTRRTPGGAYMTLVLIPDADPETLSEKTD